MISEIRKIFNEAFSEDAYNKYVNDINSSFIWPVDFRLSETPVFLTQEITDDLVKACEEITSQIFTDKYKQFSRNAVPKDLIVPNETTHPEFLQIDFAIAIVDGKIVPRLIELQGFPSLYAFQYYQEYYMRKNFHIPVDMTPYFSGYDSEIYLKAFKEIILQDNKPVNVILLEIEPEKQKTRIDFAATKALLGIEPVCITKVYKRGHDLFYKNSGREIKIKRIYNRVIFDELLRRNIKSGFDYREEISAEWVTHPNWFFRISKYGLPFIKSQYASHAFFLNQPETNEIDLNNYVLKPLYSFAGLGVDIEPTAEKISAIPDKENYILQEKIEYAPLIQTPDGDSKVEIRMMFLWNHNKPMLVNNLVRMSKGKMMGVDFNKNKTWVGSSLAFHPEY